MPRKVWFGLVLFSGLLIYQFFIFNVLQDDAFISFRYVKNFLSGHGLVFNIGERVEGYTNFLWIILLALLTKLGLPIITTARVLGIIFSAATIGLGAYAAYKFYPRRSWLWTLSVPLLLAANGALAYWAGSGLETGLFTFLAAAAAICYFSQPGLSFVFLTLSALTRPEGAILAFLFGIAGLLLKEKSWSFTFKFWGTLALIMLPYAIFKWLYFGSLLPNPFYAKTGFSIEYWKSGLEYSFLFLKQYGLFGLTLILPLLLWKKLTPFSRFCFLTFAGYGLYVTTIGGDVLKAHRFFIPLLALFYLPFVDSIHQLAGNQWYKPWVFAANMLFFAFYSYRIPLTYLKTSAGWEQELVLKMSNSGRFFAENKTAKIYAVSTIGAFSYYVGRGRVIDMLGLTEPAVARNPEKIEGLVSTWKERRFNAGYVLSRKPDVILFSTGFKPSAPAERTLFLYPDFRQNYRLEFFFRPAGSNAYFQRFRNIPTQAKPDQPAEFGNLINEGINRAASGNYRSGVALLHRTLEGGAKDCAALYIILGNYCLPAGEPGWAETYLKKGMELDEGGSIGRYYYRNLLYFQKRYAEAEQLDSIIIKTIPNFAEFLRSTGASR